MYGAHYIGANDSYALDSAQDSKLVFAVAEDLTADRQLDFVVGDANRKINLTPTADHALMYDLASTTWKSKDIVDTLTAIFKTDGSRNVTGQLVSTFAAGAPFAVADNTMVANLNADLLDGSHASAFSLAAHTHTFLQLTDVPASYATHALELVRVNAGATALEFSAPVTTTFLALTDVPASYATHGDKTVMVNTGATALEFLGPWLDQDVRVAATPTFGGLTVDGNVTLTSCSSFSISDSPGNTSVTMDGTLSVGSTCNIVGLFTANQQIVSTLADGGAMPINVTSPVKCVKLNADLLDGKHASDFALAAANFTDNALIRGDGGGKGIQGSGVLLDDGDNMLVPTTAKLMLDSSSQYLHATSASFVTLNAVTGINFGIGGTTEATLSENALTFANGIVPTSLVWGTSGKLQVGVDGIPQVAFTDGTIEPVTTNDIDLGTSSKEFKAGFFVGEVRAGNFVADAADSFVLDGFGLVIGHTAQIDFGATPEFQVLGTEVPDSSMGFATFNVVASNAPDLRFLKSRGVTIGSNVLVQDGDRLGRIRFQGADGNDFNTTAAEFQVEVDGAASLNNVFGRFVWRTRTSGGLNEKMSLSAEGTLDIVNLCKASAYESDVATGTAPLVVASTTVVPNLNVDQVDGKDSTDLLLVDGSQALSADWNAGSFVIQAAGFFADGDPGGAGVGTIVWTGITVDKSVGGPTFPALPSGYTSGGHIWLKCYANGVEGAVPFWRKT